MLTATLAALAVLAGLAAATTARRAARLARRLHTDPLTGLPNRDALIACFTRAVRGRRRASSAIGVLLADLDQFKTINDRHGHHIGNLALSVVAERLRAATAGRPELAVRLHGDEFAVLLRALPPGPAAQHHAEARAAELAAALAHPVAVAGRPITLGASIGAATCTTTHADLSALLRAADQRMYAHKTSHRPVRTSQEAQQ